MNDRTAKRVRIVYTINEHNGMPLLGGKEHTCWVNCPNDVDAVRLTIDQHARGGRTIAVISSKEIKPLAARRGV